MNLELKSSEYLVLPTFARFSANIMAEHDIDIETSNPRTVESSIKPRGTHVPFPRKHLIPVKNGQVITVGSGAGQVKLISHDDQNLSISPKDQVRWLSDEVMLSKSDSLKTQIHMEFNALCLAYLAGKTVRDLESRPDAIFPSASKPVREAALNAMKEHGYLKCLITLRVWLNNTSP